MKCIEEEIPFAVPEGWVWCRLNTIVDVRDGTHDTPKYVEKGVPLFTSKNLCAKGLDYSNVKYISYEDAKIINERSGVDKGDILYAMIGTIGNPTIVDSSIEMSIKNVALFKFTYSLNLSNKYMFYFFSYAQEYMKKDSSGGLQPFVSLSYLRNYLVPVAPCSEQSRICEKCDLLLQSLESIDDDKSLLVDSIEKTKAKILDLAIRGKLVSQDPNDESAHVLLERIREEKERLIKQGKIKRDRKESIIYKSDDNSYFENINGKLTEINIYDNYELPMGWEFSRLKTICTKIIDGAHNPPKGTSNITPYIMASSRNIADDTITDLENVRYLDEESFIKEHQRTNVSINDVLLTTVATLGRCSIYAGVPEKLTFQRSVSVITTLIDPMYLKLFFDCPLFQHIINTEATGTAQKGFYLNQLEDVIIPIPPLSEQQQIVSVVKQYNSQLMAISNCL